MHTYFCHRHSKILKLISFLNSALIEGLAKYGWFSSLAFNGNGKTGRLLIVTLTKLYDKGFVTCLRVRVCCKISMHGFEIEHLF